MRKGLVTSLGVIAAVAVVMAIQDPRIWAALGIVLGGSLIQGIAVGVVFAVGIAAVAWIRRATLVARLAALNGWQRLGVAGSVVWCFLVAAFAVVEYFDQPKNGVFFVQVNKWDVVSERPITDALPRGGWDVVAERPVVASKRQVGAPWELDAPVSAGKAPWEKDPVVVPLLKHELHAGRLLGFMLVPPLVVWLLAYLAIWTIRWIGAGFKRKED